MTSHAAFTSQLRGQDTPPGRTTRTTKKAQDDSISILAGMKKKLGGGKKQSSKEDPKEGTESLYQGEDDDSISQRGISREPEDGDDGSTVRKVPTPEEQQEPDEEPALPGFPGDEGPGDPDGPRGGRGGGPRPPRRNGPNEGGGLERPTIKGPKPSTPTTFKGDRSKWITFAIEAAMFFAHYEEYFEGKELMKSVYFLGWFEGDTVRPWADEILSSVGGPEQHPLLTNFTLLLEKTAALWGPINEKQNAQNKLETIYQDTTVSAYHARFIPLMSRSGYNEEALTKFFYKGLKEAIKNLMINIERPETVEGLLEVALNLESRILARIEERKSLGTRDKTNTKDTSYGRESSKVGKLSEEERKKCMKEGRCFLCKQIGHMANACPKKVATTKKGTTDDTHEKLKDTEDFPLA
jgi:Zinc knuckle